MRRFDALCLPQMRSLKAADIRRIRKQANMSLAVFAAALKVGTATVAAWEQGGRPLTHPLIPLPRETCPTARC